jgi:hypothetical protein
VAEDPVDRAALDEVGAVVDAGEWHRATVACRCGAGGGTGIVADHLPLHTIGPARLAAAGNLMMTAKNNGIPICRRNSVR